MGRERGRGGGGGERKGDLPSPIFSALNLVAVNGMRPILSMTLVEIQSDPQGHRLDSEVGDL